MKKIHDDQGALHDLVPSTNREKIRHFGPAAYAVVDMLVTLEHAASLFKDVFATPVLSKQLGKELRRQLSASMKTAEKWQPVRNKLGGHLDLSSIESACDSHGFRGVFLSEDLETDVSVLNAILIESAFNQSGFAQTHLGRQIDLRSGISMEVQVMITLLNGDWEKVFSCFNPLMQKMYAIGKEEKEAVTPPSERKGIVVGN